MNLKIHHVGYLVRKIDKAIKAFVNLGFTVIQDTVYDDYRQIDICFMEKDGYVVELVCPKSKESVVYGLLKRTSNSPYHICYSVADLKEASAWLEENGYVLSAEAHEAPALGGAPVCFYIHPFLGMVELVEEKESK